jgi:hypothetical protein
VGSTLADTAFLDAEYVRAFDHDGSAVQLPRSGGWLNVDTIDEYVDARHVYPGLFCRDWSLLLNDLAELELVSVVAMVFPIGVRHERLCELFPLVRPIKEQYVVRHDVDWSLHHVKAVKRARRQVEVELVAEASAGLPSFARMYDELRWRHKIVGTEDYPLDSLRRQLALSSARLFRADLDGRTVAMQLWLQEGDWAHYVIGCADVYGYRTEASYALTSYALLKLRGLGAREIDLGRVPEGATGLVAFKQGWGAEARPAYLCGRVLDRTAYDVLCERHGQDDDWFPAYRSNGRTKKPGYDVRSVDGSTS